MKSVHRKIKDEISGRVLDQVSGRVLDQVWNQVRLEIEDQMFDQAVFHVYVYDQMIHEVGS